MLDRRAGGQPVRRFEFVERETGRTGAEQAGLKRGEAVSVEFRPQDGEEPQIVRIERASPGSGSGPHAGAAGTPMTWYWDSYVEVNNLYYHFAHLAAYTAGINWLEENYAPAQVVSVTTYFWPTSTSSQAKAGGSASAMRSNAARAYVGECRVAGIGAPRELVEAWRYQTPKGEDRPLKHVRNGEVLRASARLKASSGASSRPASSQRASSWCTTVPYSVSRLSTSVAA